MRIKLFHPNDPDDVKVIGSLLLIILIMAIASILFSYPVAWLIRHSF